MYYKMTKANDLTFLDIICEKYDGVFINFFLSFDYLKKN